MKVVVIMAVVIAACASHHATQQDAADAPAAMPDACPTVIGGGPTAPIDDCDPGGLATGELDGTWHVQGSATSWTESSGSNMMSTTAAVDEYMTIQRMGCFTSMTIGATPTTDVPTNATPTALTHDCYYMQPECFRGSVTWSICVSNGVLRYRRDESQQHLEMQWGGTELDTLTR